MASYTSVEQGFYVRLTHIRAGLVGYENRRMRCQMRAW